MDNATDLVLDQFCCNLLPYDFLNHAPDKAHNTNDTPETHKGGLGLHVLATTPEIGRIEFIVRDSKPDRVFKNTR